MTTRSAPHPGTRQSSPTVAILDRLDATVKVDCSGGLQRVALSDLGLLAERGIDARFYVGRLEGEAPGVVDLGIPLFPTAHRWLRRILFLLGALRFAWAGRRSVVWMLLNVPQAGVLCPSRCIVVMQIPVSHYRLPAHRLLRERYRRMHYVFCSEATRSEFVAVYPWMERCSQVVYNGVDTSELRCEPHASRPRLRFLFAASWTRLKGLHHLLEAAELLAERAAEFEVQLAGSAYLWWRGHAPRALGDMPERVREYRQRLANLRVIGEVRHDDLTRLLNDADVLVSPSVWEEPFGLINAEAMACGIPVIASRAGGIPEVVVHEQTGLLVPPGDSESLAEAMAYALDHPQALRAMGERGRKRVESRFGRERRGRRLVELVAARGGVDALRDAPSSSRRDAGGPSGRRP